jgi:RNA polymerase sigma-70 factor (ECF subfamily)
MMERRTSDGQLARRMLAGDERAFEAFFDGHFPALYRFALVRLAYDADAAEEVAQTAMCKAVSKLGTYRGEALLFTWLCTFCRREIWAVHRRRRQTGRAIELVEDTPEVRAALESLVHALDAGPEETLIRGELRRLVQLTLDRLPVRYRNALEWKYVEEVSVNEIAGRLALSSKAAESLLTRAREAFRHAFSVLTRNRDPRPSLAEPGR